ncbi:MAG: polysaccharide deacetylase family protein [candidate division WWE3 bacterium]|nr:polysaccharide deacetylase family protein [candidate division WWE3 bacterium]
MPHPESKYIFVITTAVLAIVVLLVTTLTPPMTTLLPSTNTQTSTLSPKPQSSRTSLLMTPREASVTAQATKAVTLAKVQILTYHYVEVNPNPKDRLRTGLAVTPSNFGDQLDYLDQQQITPITLSDYYNILDGKLKTPVHPVILTFDDGYADFFANAYPLLLKHHFKAVSFIITGSIGKSNYMTWDQIKEIQQSGLIEFEDHTVTHPDLRRLSYKAIYDEFYNSKVALETQTGSKVEYVAYPYGYFNDTALKAAQAVGFVGGVSTRGGIAAGKSRTLPRDNVNGYTTMQRFEQIVGK